MTISLEVLENYQPEETPICGDLPGTELMCRWHEDNNTINFDADEDEETETAKRDEEIETVIAKLSTRYPEITLQQLHFIIYDISLMGFSCFETYDIGMQTLQMTYPEWNVKELEFLLMKEFPEQRVTINNNKNDDECSSSDGYSLVSKIGNNENNENEDCDSDGDKLLFNTKSKVDFDKLGINDDNINGNDYNDNDNINGNKMATGIELYSSPSTGILSPESMHTNKPFSAPGFSSDEITIADVLSNNGDNNYSSNDINNNNGYGNEIGNNQNNKNPEYDINGDKHLLNTKSKVDIDIFYVNDDYNGSNNDINNDNGYGNKIGNNENNENEDYDIAGDKHLLNTKSKVNFDKLDNINGNDNNNDDKINGNKMTISLKLDSSPSTVVLSPESMHTNKPFSAPGFSSDEITVADVLSNNDEKINNDNGSNIDINNNNGYGNEIGNNQNNKNPEYDINGDKYLINTKIKVDIDIFYDNDDDNDSNNDINNDNGYGNKIGNNENNENEDYIINGDKHLLITQSKVDFDNLNVNDDNINGNENYDNDDKINGNKMTTRLKLDSSPSTVVLSPESMHTNKPFSAPGFSSDEITVAVGLSPSFIHLLQCFISLQLSHISLTFPLPPFPSTSLTVYSAPFLPPPLLYPLALFRYFHLCARLTTFLFGPTFYTTRNFCVSLPQNGVA
jgi:hypothetical protein